MTTQEWKTLGLFGALFLGISLISERIAYVGIGAIALSLIVTQSKAIFGLFKGGQ